MTIQIQRVLMLLCLGLPVIAVGATDAAQTEAATTTESGAAEEVETEAVLVKEADAEQTTETESTHAEESNKRSIFSRMIEWFRGEPSEVAPEQEQATAEKDITLSDVYQATRDMIAEIEILRKATGVADAPRKMVLRHDQAPIYAYSKSLEVMEKTARVQRRFGMIPVEIGTIPVKRITPEDLYRSVQIIIKELRRIKRQLVVRDQIQPASVAGGKTPSLVYKNLGDASYLLDGLVGRPTTPNDVHMHVLRIQVEMKSIAAKLKAALDSDPPAVEGDKEPKEVAQQVLRATYKAINLQSRLGMDASSVPNLTLVEVTPTEVFDATNILLAEIVRIKVHLNIQSPPAAHPESQNMQSADVFGQVLLIISNLEIMTRAAGNTE